MNWLRFLGEVIAASVVSLPIVGYLAKKFIEHRLDVELETHKSQLIQKTEVLKTQLSIYANEQNVGLSRIDAQRTDAIQEIWGVLTKWDDVFVEITAPNRNLHKDARNALAAYQVWGQKLVKIAEELSVMVRNKAILVSQDTYSTINNCGKSILHVSCNFYAESFEGVDFNAETSTQVGLQLLFDKVQDARDELKNDTGAYVSDFRKALVHEFRVIMKAEKP